MRLFARKQKTQQPVVEHLPQYEETIAMPAAPLSEVPETPTILPGNQSITVCVKTVECLQICAGCGEIGAMKPLPHPVGYFGYMRLSYIRLCDTCANACAEGRKRHYEELRRRSWASKETLIEQPSVMVGVLVPELA